VEVIGERELAFRESLCLHLAIAGAGGKSTTAGMIAHVLRAAGRRVEVACGVGSPACLHVEGSRDLDFLVHGIEPGELEHLEYFRPVVAVLLNAPLDFPGLGSGAGEAERALGRLFARQQAFDWAILEKEAWSRLRAAGVGVPAKRLTFSTTDTEADLGVDRGLLLSRLPDWAGALWDTARAGLRGPHLAEDALATLAVGHVLRIPLEEMTLALEGFRAGPGCFEHLGAADGVSYIHDGRCRNVDSLRKSLLGVAPTPPERPFVQLIAGGDVAGRGIYELGPVMAARVKEAVLFGEAAPALHAAWGLFTPCTPMTSLVDAAHRAINQAQPGETVLFSPGCPSSPDPGGDVFRSAVGGRLEAAPAVDPALSPPSTPGGKTRA